MALAYCNGNKYPNSTQLAAVKRLYFEQTYPPKDSGITLEHNRAENFVDTDIFELGSEIEDQEDSWQTQDEIKKDVLWCAHSLRTRRYELLPDAVSKNNIIESALDWSLI